MVVEPVPGQPAAVADIDGDRALVVADFHAGIEDAIRYEQGVELDSRAGARRELLLDLVAESSVELVIFLGDFMHSIGGPGGAERGEIEVLLETLDERDVDALVVKGNHDGDIESFVDAPVTAGDGVRIGDVGFVHGHTWPGRDVLDANVVCIGHEHPTVRLEDTVGGSRIERVWLRGPLDRDPFSERLDDLDWNEPELIVFPAYNDLVGGTWLNVKEQGFLTPFLPDGLVDGNAYLLDGTRLGKYRSI